MAPSCSAHGDEPIKRQKSVPLAQCQLKPVVPVIPRELEKKKDGNVIKKSPVQKSEHGTKIVDAKVKEAVTDEIHQPSIAVGLKRMRSKSSSAFAVPEIPPFKPKNSLKQDMEHRSISESHLQPGLPGQGYNHQSVFAAHGVTPQEQQLFVGNEYESVKSWKPLTPDEPLSTPSHPSSAQTPLLQSHDSSSSSFSTRVATGPFDQVYPEQESFCYHPTAINYGFTPYSQPFYPLSSMAQDSPYKFEKPMTPSTILSDKQSTSAAQTHLDLVLGGDGMYSHQDSEPTTNMNAYYADSFVQNAIPAPLTESPTSLEESGFHRDRINYNQPLDTMTNLLTALNGNGYYTGGSAQVMQSGTSSNLLIEYLLQHIDNPEFADCQLEICTGDEITRFKVHALVIGQSPFLRALVSSASYVESTGMKHLGFRTSNEYGSAVAFAAALRVLYGADPSMTLGDLCSCLNNDGSVPVESTNLDIAIAYTFAAKTLEIPQTHVIGIDAIRRNLSLDGLEKTVAFALNGDPETITSSSVSPFESDGGVTLNNAFQRAHATSQVIDAVIQFMAYNFPQAFVLDVTVPSTSKLGAPIDYPGSPRIQKAAKPTSRLSSIRFGDMPIEEDLLPSRESTIFSKLLLSLPEQWVYCLFDRLEGWVSPQTCSLVMEERKKRFEAVSTQGEDNGQS